ncbi:ankyrin [Stipitochalara longipes BDJ]|nr:ankyrin [Stipitochalara longipes BDJ]
MGLGLLCEVIDQGNLDEVKKALASAPNPTEIISRPSARGCTPLALSIIYCQVDIARYLLENGADANAGYRAEWVDKLQHVPRRDLLEICPPIYCASRLGFSDLIDLLVSHGAAVNSATGLDKGSQVAPLHCATGRAVEALIKAGADVDHKNEFGWTPLIYAISREDLDAIRVFVRHGAEVNIERRTRYKVRLRNGQEKLMVGTSSPLMVACGHGRLTPKSGEMIEILAAAGADVNHRYTVELGPEDGPPLTFTALELICGSIIERPIIQSPHNFGEGYNEKEKNAIGVLLKAGAIADDPVVAKVLANHVL